MNCKPFVGAIYGRLLVTGLDGKFAVCRCACGGNNHFTTRTANLKNGSTKSCGCLRREAGLRNKTHGQTKTPEYRVWNQLRARCNDPKDKSFPVYGGRGIKVCSRWEASFEAFKEDMGPRPSPTHSIDRKDNDGDYSPGNCRWATKLEQTRNRRCAVNVSHAGVTLPLQVWCDRYQADYSTVHSRLFKHGWSLDLALFAPKHFRLEFWRPIAWVGDDFPPVPSTTKEHA